MRIAERLTERELPSGLVEIDDLIVLSGTRRAA
jgi:hypothetical protein